MYAFHRGCVAIHSNCFQMPFGSVKSARAVKVRMPPIRQCKDGQTTVSGLQNDMFNTFSIDVLESPLRRIDGHMGTKRVETDIRFLAQCS